MSNNDPAPAAENAEPLKAILESAAYCCADCGKKYGTWRGPTMTTWHDGTCEVCGKHAGVVHVRRYNYLVKREGE